MAIRRLLVPTDFSECSDAAGTLAGELARKLGAAVDVVTVIDTAPLHDGYGDVVYRDQRIAAIRTAAMTKLDAFVARHLGDVSRVQAVIRDGNGFDEILAMARDVGSDMIVMGTHGRTGLPHLLIGSVAEKVVRHSPVPVLTVRPATP